MKNSFTTSECYSALTELYKVWQYEQQKYNGHHDNPDDIARLDKETVSYGIVLGTLRSIFESKPNSP
jgi:hypothetical protein